MQLSQYKDKDVFTNGEVLDIRRKVMAPEKVLKRDAEALMRLNETITTPTEAWKTLFSDAIVDYVVDSSASSGYLVADYKAKWLIEEIDADQHLDPETELNLLIKVMTKANIISPVLEVYMLKAVKDAVLNGSGFWAQGREMQAGCVGADDVELLRKIMYSVGGQGGIDISREEAEVIYDIHDATVGADNHESWDVMFSKMIACYMMAGMSSLEVDESWAVGRDVWLESDKGIDWSISNILKGYASFGKNQESPKPYVLDRDLQTSLEAITEEEAFWLIERINADGRLTPSEAKMLMYLEQECPNLHASLNGYIKSEVYR